MLSHKPAEQGLTLVTAHCTRCAGQCKGQCRPWSWFLGRNYHGDANWKPRHSFGLEPFPSSRSGRLQGSGCCSSIDSGHKSWPGCADNTVQITAPAGPAHPKGSASSQILLCWCWLPAPRPEGSGGRGSTRRSAVRAELQRRLTGTGLGVCPFQCQDLVSQTSSPLSQNDSCTGRSADLLLPSGDTGKRQHERGSEVAPYSRVDRYKAQVSACFRASCGPLCTAQCRLPLLWSQRGVRMMHGGSGSRSDRASIAAAATSSLSRRPKSGKKQGNREENREAM